MGGRGPRVAGFRGGRGPGGWNGGRPGNWKPGWNGGHRRHYGHFRPRWYGVPYYGGAAYYSNYYYDDYYSDDDYVDDGGDAVVYSDGGDAVARCEARYRSFDRASGTFLSTSGERKLCPYLR
jgi:hypothetical protein